MPYNLIEAKAQLADLVKVPYTLNDLLNLAKQVARMELAESGFSGPR